MEHDHDQWLTLRVWAEMFEDAQRTRIGATNRLARGHVDATLYEPYIEALKVSEETCAKGLRSQMRRTVPAAVREWQKNEPGIGEHLLARLLGQLGHPVIATPFHWEGTGNDRTLVADKPFVRSVETLWQYAGHGGPSTRRKGMSVEETLAMGKPKAKMVLHLLCESCIKQKGKGAKYRTIYDVAREEVAEKLHTVECVRCGPSGKPAQPGSPWSLGHQHAHALRMVGKAILQDLWLLSGGAALRSEAIAA